MSRHADKAGATKWDPGGMHEADPRAARLYPKNRGNFMFKGKILSVDGGEEAV